jgi:acyl dehydratase
MNVLQEGKAYPETRFTVEESEVARFRAVVGGDPVAGVPLTFVTAAEFSAFPAIVGDPALALDFSRVVHAEQEYEFSRPLRLGETLTVSSRIAQARVRAGQGFLTIETLLLDEDGFRVCTARATMLERGSR